MLHNNAFACSISSNYSFCLLCHIKTSYLIIFQRKASDEDVGKICSSLLSVFSVPEKSAESMSLLRQLFFILQARDEYSKYWLLKQFVQFIIILLSLVCPIKMLTPHLKCTFVHVNILKIKEYAVWKKVLDFGDNIYIFFHFFMLCSLINM